MDSMSSHPSYSLPRSLLLAIHSCPLPTQHIVWGQKLHVPTPSPFSLRFPHKPQPHLCLPHKLICVVPRGQLAVVVCVCLSRDLSNNRIGCLTSETFQGLPKLLRL